MLTQHGSDVLTSFGDGRCCVEMGKRKRPSLRCLRIVATIFRALAASITNDHSSKRRGLINQFMARMWLELDAVKNNRGLGNWGEGACRVDHTCPPIPNSVPSDSVLVQSAALDPLVSRIIKHKATTTTEMGERRFPEAIFRHQKRGNEHKRLRTSVAN